MKFLISGEVSEAFYRLVEGESSVEGFVFSFGGVEILKENYHGFPCTVYVWQEDSTHSGV